MKRADGELLVIFSRPVYIKADFKVYPLNQNSQNSSKVSAHAKSLFHLLLSYSQKPKRVVRFRHGSISILKESKRIRINWKNNIFDKNSTRFVKERTNEKFSPKFPSKKVVLFARILTLVDNLFNTSAQNSTGQVLSPDERYFRRVVNFYKNHKKSRKSTTTNSSAPKSYTLSVTTTEKAFAIGEMAKETFMCIPGIPFKLECTACYCTKNSKELKTCSKITCKPTMHAPLRSFGY